MRLARSVVLGAAVLPPATAVAGDGVHPRVLTMFLNEECMAIVHKGDTYHFPYGIPGNQHEEPPPGDQGADWDHPRVCHELTDARTHQFFAFGRGRGPQEHLPGWITWADVQREADLATSCSCEGECPGTIDPADLTDDDVLETATAWEGLWFRIDPDDARRAINCDTALQGVDFATTDVPVGVYVIEGYTWEPPASPWAKRNGAVKVIDDINDPDSGPPALAIMNGEEIVYSNQSIDISGCVDAMDGSTLTGEWARSDANPDWIVFLADEPVMTGNIVIPFNPPDAADGSAISVRLTITDPMDRTYTGYMNQLVVALPASSGCEETDGGGGFIGMSCDTDDTGGAGGDDFGDLCEGEGSTSGGEETGTTGASAESTSASTAAQDDSSGGSCNCRSTPFPTPVSLMGLGLLALVRRRRETWAS